MHIFLCILKVNFVDWLFLVSAKCILMKTFIPPEGHKEAATFHPFRKEYCPRRGQGRVTLPGEFGVVLARDQLLVRNSTKVRFCGSLSCCSQSRSVKQDKGSGYR